MSSGKRRMESGQALILMVLAMTVIFVIGVIIVDVGLWISERRGAYKDADASALAGAQAYVADLTDTGGAFDDARVWAELNGVNPANIDAGQTLDCSPDNSCIDAQLTNCGESDLMPWVEARIRHESNSIFSGIFALIAPDIGAEARACVGSPRGASGLSPFGVSTGFGASNGPPETDPDGPPDPLCENNLDDDNDGDINDGCPLSDCLERDPDTPSKTRPVYGAVCVLKAPGQGGISGQRGQLTLSDTGCSGTSTNQLRHDFHFGSKGTCNVDQEVNTGTGTINGLLQGLEDRLAEEGLCDDRFGSSPNARIDYDEFQEVFSVVGGSGGPVVPSATNIFSQNDCDITCGPSCPSDGDPSHKHNYLPRAIDLVLVDQFEPNGQTATITGFAGFYVIGCFRDNVVEASKQAIEQNLTNFGLYLNRCEKPTGQDLIIGIFVKTLAPGLNVGNPDSSLPLSIVLVK